MVFLFYICTVAMKQPTKPNITMTTKTQTRPTYEIVREIRKDWKNVNYGAVPYLDAMATLDSVNDNYMFDSGKSIVLYFLSNANTWRGENAKRIKAELKSNYGIK